MSDLASRSCVVCEVGGPCLPEEAAADLETQLAPAWQREGNVRLQRDFRFRNFADAFGLATRVALLAENEGHHPDLEISWGRLRVTLTTHAAKGLTENDFVMAAKIDRLS